MSPFQRTQAIPSAIMSAYPPLAKWAACHSGVPRLPTVSLTESQPRICNEVVDRPAGRAIAWNRSPKGGSRMIATMTALLILAALMVTSLIISNGGTGITWL